MGDRHYRLSRELLGASEGPRAWHSLLAEAAATWALSGRRYEAITFDIHNYLFSPAAVDETVVMPTGARFRRVSDPAFDALGPAWRDEATGLIWSERGPRDRMTHSEAEVHCRSLGARLPTKTEFEAWGRALGAGGGGLLNHLFPGAQQGYFWSSSVHADYDAYIFHGGIGDVYYDVSSSGYDHFAVRCVR